MRRSGILALGCAAGLAIAGCGSDDPVVSPACTDSPAAVQVALRSAPGQVRLADGTSLSKCISAATDDADLQNVGIAFHLTAEKLGDAATVANKAALQLGYLIGAMRRGAAKTNGVLAELQRRIELVGSRVQERVPALRAALEKGRAAGEASG
jgi:hypothetical protein